MFEWNAHICNFNDVSDMLTKLFLQVDESNSELSRIGNYGWGEFGTDMDVSHSDDLFGIDPFYINKGNNVMPHSFI